MLTELNSLNAYIFIQNGMHVFLKSDRFDFVTLSKLAPGEHNTAVNESCPFITLPSSAAAPAHLGV